METVTAAGLDVDARSTEAAALSVVTGEIERQRFVGSEVAPVVAWLAERPGRVRAVYEAGPTGFGLYRAATEAGIAMQVCAPSKVQRASGDRVKSDRRDAELLARLLLAGQLKAVAVPDCRTEAARELARSHDDVRVDLMAGRHRVSKQLLRHGQVYSGASTWGSTRHRQWLAARAFADPLSELAFSEALAHVDALTHRKQALAERLSRLATDDQWWPIVARLRCFRGVDTLTAFMLHLELGGDWQRFATPGRLTSWLGLTPSLHQSGQSRTQGAITKTGSMLARRLLVEAAWHYQRPPRIGVTLRGRHAGQPEPVIAIAWRAQHRLHRVHHRLRERGKPGNVATVAAARELACFLWAAATH